MNKRKALIITNLFPNPQELLRGIFVANMVTHLSNECDLTVISPLPWVPRAGFLKKLKGWHKFSVIPERFKSGEIDVLCPKYLAIPKLGFLHSVFMFIAILPLVSRLKKAARADLINAHWVFPDGVAAGWAARILRLPLVLSARGSDINLYAKFKFRRLQILPALRYSKKITVVSQALKKVIEKLGVEPEKIEVIRNGVESEIFNIKDKIDCRRRLKINEDARMILFVGRLIKVKGFNFLIEALAELKRPDTDNFKLFAIGEGDLRPQFENTIRRLGMDEDIIFSGEKSRAELPFWYGACDVFCLPSIQEGCPNVILEALASGRPVVASRVGGIPELVNAENGILFESSKVRELSTALMTAMNKRWSADDISGSVKNFTWRGAAGRFARIFDESLKAA